MLISKLQEIVGPNGWTSDATELEPHLSERRGAVTGRALIMVSPASTQEVSDIVAACAGEGTAVVPQGGNTGLCGGAIPDASGDQVLLSLRRMNRIRAVDPDDFSMTVEAGCILENVQKAAQEVKRLFPLSLGAEGSCQIGGNLSTNAGGINVIRYGTARQQVLGLEVVLADGTVWDGLRSLRKDTGGYDLKQLFLGSEGTLGIITAATLRLYPENSTTVTAMFALQTAAAATALLARLRHVSGDRLLAFEIMSDTAVRMALDNIPGLANPFAAVHPWFALVETATDEAGPFVDRLAAELDGTAVLDAVVAKSAREADALWAIRHGIPEAQGAAGVSLKHDISVPVGRVDEFISRAAAAVLDIVPEAKLVTFGHAGDGNLHYNISQPPDADAEQFRLIGKAASDRVYELVAELGGSFSAEHGVGTLKKQYLQAFRSNTELALMRTLKRALDPQNTLNPGKVI